MGVDEAAGDRETEAAAVLRHAGRAVEGLEDTLAVLSGNADAVVDDVDLGSRGRGEQHEPHLPRGVLQGVLHEVLDALQEAARVDAPRHVRREVELHAWAREVREERGERLVLQVEDGRGVHRLEVREVREERELHGAFPQALQHAGTFRVAEEVVVLQQVGGEHELLQGTAQLVGRHGAQFPSELRLLVTATPLLTPQTQRPHGEGHAEQSEQQHADEDDVAHEAQPTLHLVALHVEQVAGLQHELPGFFQGAVEAAEVSGHPAVQQPRHGGQAGRPEGLHVVEFLEVQRVGDGAQRQPTQVLQGHALRDVDARVGDRERVAGELGVHRLVGVSGPGAVRMVDGPHEGREGEPREEGGDDRRECREQHLTRQGRTAVTGPRATKPRPARTSHVPAFTWAARGSRTRPTATRSGGRRSGWGTRAWAARW